jgi:hypothetical protein
LAGQNSMFFDLQKRKWYVFRHSDANSMFSPGKILRTPMM